MIIIRTNPNFGRPFIVDIILNISYFREQTSIFGSIVEVRSCVDGSLRVLEHVIVYVKFIHQKV